MRPLILFFLELILVIHGHLKFHMNFRMDFSISAKNAIGILIGIDCFVYIGILTILSRPTCDHRMTVQLFLSLTFFSMNVQVFQLLG